MGQLAHCEKGDMAFYGDVLLFSVLLSIDDYCLTILIISCFLKKSYEVVLKLKKYDYCRSWPMVMDNNAVKFS